MIDPNTTKAEQLNAAIELLKSHVTDPQTVDLSRFNNPGTLSVKIHLSKYDSPVETANQILKILNDKIVLTGINFHTT